MTGSPLKSFDFFLITLLGLFLYLPTAFLINYFHYDDQFMVVNNLSIRDITDLNSLWNAFNTRFVVGLTFAFNYWLGGLSVYGYRIVNILLHIANSCLMYQLVILTAALPKIPIKKICSDVRILALFSALIFLTHPIQSAAVNFLAQRAVLLASFFYLATLIFYIKARVSQNNFYLGLALATTLLAMFCKEFTITLPFMLVVYEFFFLEKTNQNFSHRIKVLLPFFLMLAVIPLTLTRTTGTTNPSARLGRIVNASADPSSKKITVDVTRADGSFLSRKEYFFTQMNVLRTYLRLLFFPVRQNIDYDYPIARDGRNLKTIFSILLLFSLWLAVWFFFNINRLISFGIVWFFSTLSVESSFIPLPRVIEEYRLYLAMAGFALMMPFVLFRIVGEVKKSIIAMGFIICIFMLLTFHRNYVWSDELRLWEDTVSKSPNKPTALNNLASVLIKRGKDDESLGYLQKAISINPSFADAYLNLGLLASKQQNFSGAIDYYLKGISLKPFNLADAYRKLGFVYANLKDFHHAILCYQKSLAMNARDKDTRVLLLLAYLAQKDFSSARREIAVFRTIKENQLADELESYIKEIK